MFELCIALSVLRPFGIQSMSVLVDACCTTCNTFQLDLSQWYPSCRLNFGHGLILGVLAAFAASSESGEISAHWKELFFGARATPPLFCRLLCKRRPLCKSEPMIQRRPLFALKRQQNQRSALDVMPPSMSRQTHVLAVVASAHKKRVTAKKSMQ